VRIISPDGERFGVPSGIGRIIPGFGATIAADGDRVAISNPRDGSGFGFGSGAVYLFKRSGLNWFLESKVVASDKFGGLYFGVGPSGGPGTQPLTGVDGLEGGIDLADRVLVVGTMFGHNVLGRPKESPLGTQTGVAYVFERESTRWRETARLTGEFWPRRAQFTNFGAAVATDGRTVLVASKWGGEVQGPAIYAFEKRPGPLGTDVWTEVAQLPWQDQQPVFVSGDWAASGTTLFARVGGEWIPFDTLPGKAEGFDGKKLLTSTPTEIFVLVEEGGTLVVDDSYPNPANSPPGLPAWVARTDRWTILGGPTCRWNLPQDSGGGATIFSRSGGVWTPTPWKAPDGHPCDRYGKEVEIDGDLAYIAAPGEEDAEGAVYVVSLSGKGCGTLSFDMQSGEPWDDATLRRPNGGRQILQLDAGPEHAGRMYLLVGSRSGTSPGIALRSWRLPLNLDPYFKRTVGQANMGPFTNNLGVLDGEGRATVTFELPRFYDPALADLYHHAFVVFAPTKGFVHVSNAVNLRVLAGLHF
jgi:hypothetical protein